MHFHLRLFAASFLFLFSHSGLTEEPVSISGVYPHLTLRNNEGECGTGAVVPLAGGFVGYYLCAPSTARFVGQTLSNHARS